MAAPLRALQVRGNLDRMTGGVAILRGAVDEHRRQSRGIASREGDADFTPRRTAL